VSVKFSNGDEVIQEGRFVTVRVGDIKATRWYSDPWYATRAVATLKKGPSARANFFKRLKTDRRGTR
jgi:hypothetical protein